MKSESNSFPGASNEDVWPVRESGGAGAGKLTSMAHSPRLEKNIAVAMLGAEFTAIGMKLEVGTWDGPRIATVTGLPFLPTLQQGSARALETVAQGG